MRDQFMEEKQSQISTFIGMGLIFLLLYLWMQYSVPPKLIGGKNQH